MSGLSGGLGREGEKLGADVGRLIMNDLVRVDQVTTKLENCLHVGDFEFFFK